jgi:hypothetical protein
LAADIRLHYKIEYTISNGSNHNHLGLTVAALNSSKPTNELLNLWSLGMKGKKSKQHLLSTCYMPNAFIKHLLYAKYFCVSVKLNIFQVEDSLGKNNNPMFLPENNTVMGI